MNGFVGLLDLGGHNRDCARVAASMAGGDAACAWSDASAGIAVAAAALAPSGDGRWVAALDGTLFNGADLGRRLELGHRPDDAAVVAEAVARWGIDRGLQALDGAYAAALWDRVERRLHLVRDGFGQRPLVWAKAGGCVLFATGLAALRRHPAFAAAIDRDALATMLRLGFVPAPQSIYGGARKLTPGTLLSVKGMDHAARPLWSAAERMAGLAGSFAGGPAAAAERLNLLLRGSVAARMSAGGTAAVLRSGGPASSLVAAIARDLGGDVRTVTLGAVADDEALAVVSDLPRLWDEPVGHSGQVAAVLLARAAAERSAVALTGEGAAPLFGDSGYTALAGAWARNRAASPWRRRVAARFARFRSDWADLAAPTPAALLELRRSLWRGLPQPVAAPVAPCLHAPALGDAAAEMMAADVLVTLPEIGCVLTGRAAAGAGVDIRRPFLDAGLAEFAWSLPSALRTGQCLGEVLLRYRSDPVAAADPLGPTLPLDRWLAGPLAQWAGDLLAEDRLRRQGLIDPRAVAACRRHGRVRELWAVLMAQAWIDAAVL